MIMTHGLGHINGKLITTGIDSHPPTTQQNLVYTSNYINKLKKNKNQK